MKAWLLITGLILTFVKNVDADCGKEVFDKANALERVELAFPDGKLTKIWGESESSGLMTISLKVSDGRRSHYEVRDGKYLIRISSKKNDKIDLQEKWDERWESLEDAEKQSICDQHLESERGGNYRDGERGGNYRDGERGGNYRDGKRGGNYRDGKRGGNYRDGKRGGNYRGGERGGNYRDGKRGGNYRGGERGGNYRGGDTDDGSKKEQNMPKTPPAGSKPSAS